MRYTDLIKKIQTMDTTQFNRFNMTILSNITLESYLYPLMVQEFASIEVYPNISFVPYEGYQNDDYLKVIEQADILVIWLNFDMLFPDIADNVMLEEKGTQRIIDETMKICKQITERVRACSNTSIFWVGFEDLYVRMPVALGNTYMYYGIVDKVNCLLLDYFSDAIYFLDIKRILANIGVKNAYDLKNKYRWGCPYSLLLIKEVTSDIYKYYLTIRGITKKCIVLDCDNVLWGGILSEDGINNIKIGSIGVSREYQDFQHFLLSLYNNGVILAVCSKNDMSDVLEIFRKHSEMILKESHIACFQVNWDDKAKNIRKVSETLNIGLNSIVFIDDSIFEIEAVKSLLPEVTTIVYTREGIYEQLTCFNLLRSYDHESIKKRNETYQTNQKREDLKVQFESYDDYLEALDMHITIKRADVIEYNRIVELSQRTNRCTNGKRYSMAELQQKLDDGKYNLYTVSLFDKFSNLGLVGVMGIYNNTVDLFCLSCRALGRNLEDKMIEFLLSHHYIDSYTFKYTGKNDSIKDKLNRNFSVSC